jgi:hypothetical protein
MKWKEPEECEMCGRWGYLPPPHHIFNKFNKARSEKYGYMLKLCDSCHKRIHADYELWDKYKAECQRDYESKHGSREDFIEEFTRSYL